jgi:hypothetical protein
VKATSKRTASKAAASVTQSRRGLLLGVLYTDRERGTTGQGWQHPGHGDAPAHTLRMADGRVVSYRDSIHKLRLATAPERRRYRRDVSRMEDE